jgi:hypothetical protein
VFSSYFERAGLLFFVFGSSSKPLGGASTFAMRNTINLGLYALAASSIAQAEDSHKDQQTDAQLLKDIDAVSRYWGTFSQQNILQITANIPL